MAFSGKLAHTSYLNRQLDPQPSRSAQQAAGNVSLFGFKKKLHECVAEMKQQNAYKQEFLETLPKFEGYSPADVETVRIAQGVDYIPKTYDVYLLAMGHSNGGVLFWGADSSYGALKVAKESLRTILNQNDGAPSLPDNAFVFLSYQTADFFFFVAEKGIDDPPVYYFANPSEGFIQVAERLSGWFLDQSFNPLSYAYAKKPSYKEDPDIPF
jgi:hypothetical protein